MLFYIWLPLIFLLGAVVGSYLNVCISRLPLEKSILWPLGSRCGNCFQPIHWYDNLPLVSYWLLRGRCRTCKTPFSIRYFFVELLTAAGFAGLFFLEIRLNVHNFDVLDPAKQGPQILWGVIPWQGWVVFGHHAILFSFLVVASFCDLDRREIPLSVTAPGTVIGLLSSVLWAWPWPYTPAEAMQGMPPNQPWAMLLPGLGPKMGLYPWPAWGPLPDWMQPGGNWQTGLATGVAGLLVGTMLLRAVGFLFEKGLGKEALGLGDADLMMMAGSFLGWQPVAVAFFLGTFPALFFGLGQLVFRRENSLPFGPGLAIGVVMTWLGWRWIGPHVQMLFFTGWFVGLVACVGAVFMLASSYFFRLIRVMRS